MRLTILALAIAIAAASAQTKRAGIEESDSKADSGRQLFNDPILSASGKVACSTCHLKEFGFSSHGLMIGLDQKPLQRRAPSLLNRSTGKSFFWDGRAKTLEEQALQPITNPLEMGSKLPDVLVKVKAKYGIQSADELAKALADYERTLTRLDGKIDAHLRGKNVLTASEARGWNLFRGEGQCYKCHPYPTFSDEKFHNTGAGAGVDLGRYNVTHDPDDAGKFKTPGLRGCKLTAPFMHDASIESLEAIVEFYRQGGHKNANLDPDMKPLKLTTRDKADLVAFLKVL